MKRKSETRKIPVTMVSQHPDHAGSPYWLDQPLIKTHHESEELFLSFSDLGVDEYKWDWEGKLVDESVIERLYSDQYDYFKTNQLGKDKFLTFRLPNPRIETEFRVGRAFMGILSASALATQVGFSQSPIFEVILPMTESAEEMIEIQEAFQELSGLKHRLFRFNQATIKHVEMIPLFEEIHTIMDSDKILARYLDLHKWRFGYMPSYMRPYIARSDPALNSGLVSTILAMKVALSNYQALAKAYDIELHPIVGTGSLPFRGGLAPNSIKEFVEEYQGIRTALVQSAFRYDYDKPEVIKAIQQLHAELPFTKAQKVSAPEKEAIMRVVAAFEPAYKTTIEEIADVINTVASQIPKRRERVQHVGLFGYSRGVGGVKLPRAIGFTAALYSLGVPPELIGAGRGLRTIRSDAAAMAALEKFYVHFKTDLKKAGRFLNKSVLKQLAKISPAWQEVVTDVREIERYLGEELGPQTENDEKHYQLSSKLYKAMVAQKPFKDLIEKSAHLRKSMG
jgi:phosphoenolpyruvate carboxylase